MTLITHLLTLFALLFASSAQAEIDVVSGSIILDCIACPKMVVIPAGSFNMGSNIADRDERPLHRVTIAQAFAMSQTEITQVQWRAVMQDQWRTIGGKDPSFFCRLR
jgi:formylglycine-generating enzyme required for sulfatase activity